MSATPTQISGGFTPALTTFFTPPADCTQAAAFSASTWANGQIAYQLDSGVSQYTCYPPRYSSLQYDHSSWYSPGVCPVSYEYAATSISTGSLGIVRTYAVCCPPGMHTYGDQFSCTEVITSGGKLTFAETGDGATAFANPISVVWAEQDLARFTPASAPLIALSSAGITFATTSGSSNTAPATSGGPTHIQSTSGEDGAGSELGTGSGGGSDLSTGATAGIGVGATVVGLALIAGGIWWFIRRSKAKRIDEKPEERAFEQTESHPYYGQPTAGIIVEAPVEAIRVEADGESYRAELDGGWQGAEAPGGVKSPR